MRTLTEDEKKYVSKEFLDCPICGKKPKIRVERSMRDGGDLFIIDRHASSSAPSLRDLNFKWNWSVIGYKQFSEHMNEDINNNKISKTKDNKK